AYGLGSINLGMPVRSMKEQPELLAKLGFSEHYELCLIVALGYADETPEAKPRKREKVQFVTVE
ncbi:MAG: proton-conducting membrane transporter, partial [Bacteroidaceae bacterium]|nr:proton-conducting membrane transporter [Bacteroidaceae bacterium]